MANPRSRSARKLAQMPLEFERSAGPPILSSHSTRKSSTTDLVSSGGLRYDPASPDLLGAPAAGFCYKLEVDRYDAPRIGHSRFPLRALKWNSFRTSDAAMKIQNQIIISVLGYGFCLAMRALFWTIRCDQRPLGVTNPFSPETEESFVFSIWHDAVIPPLFGGRHRRMAALTSRHKDGAFVAAILRFLGIVAVRGSTGRGGVRALRQLLEIAGDRHITITPDGPRGPRRQVSSGIIYVAARTGTPIVPTAFVSTRNWSIPGSWTTLEIPQPFSRVVMYAGPPIRIPPQLTRQQIQGYCRRVQRAMEDVEQLARRELFDSVNEPLDRQRAA
ncbi:MAG: lysophospholipid acyltransferase family protein [Planctomycetales bacterium]|nr:lysophospholipid acyltransferase family protein [Planctomycetales bacterium]